MQEYNRKFIDNILTYERYNSWHRSLTQCRLPFMTIRDFDRQLYTALQNKVVLNNYDSKLYICNYNIHTFFYGSKDFKSICKKCNRYAPVCNLEIYESD